MSILINIKQLNGSTTLINMSPPFVISKLKKHVYLKLNIDYY